MMQESGDLLILPVCDKKNVRRRRHLIVWCLYGLGFILAVSGLGWNWLIKRKLPASGGTFFSNRVELEVPLFRQSDERWRLDFLGKTSSTLGAEGCAVTSAAMILKFYGVDTDPQQLNHFLNTNGGYTERGWIHWFKAAELNPERVSFLYEGPPFYWLMDWNLQQGNPVIVRLRYPDGITHFVVVAGKQGYDYLIRDPGRGWSKGLYPLREFGSAIEALRFYRRKS